MKIKFLVDRSNQAVTAEPCDPDTTLERARAGQSLLAGYVVVAAISEQNYKPSALVDGAILKATADAFERGREFECGTQAF